MSSEMSFALAVCKEAGELAMDYWQGEIKTSWKDDGSPVTPADKNCEKLIRQKIQEAFPGDEIFGEEDGGNQEFTSGRRWIVDPIDGTHNYARKVPIFATLLALEQAGEIVLGVVHAPAMRDTLWAEKNCSAYRNGTKLQVSTISRLDEAYFLFGGFRRILQSDYKSGFEQVVLSTYRQAGFGDYFNFATVMDGKAEAVLEVGLQPWDLAPMKILIEESGGKFSDLNGGHSIYHGSCLVSNGLVHEEIESILLSSNLRQLRN